MAPTCLDEHSIRSRTPGSLIVLPYDGSPPARALLRRAAAAVGRGGGRYDGVLVATVGLEPGALTGPLEEARRIAGPDVAVRLHWLPPGDPVGALRRLVESSGATLAVPLNGRGRAPWFAHACRVAEVDATVMIFPLKAHELTAAKPTAARARSASLAGTWRMLVRLVPRLRRRRAE